MPLNSHATLIADTGRAVELFPPTTCRQCNGTKKSQRYGLVKCETCAGHGWDESDTPCMDCSPAVGVRGSGQRQIPESTPCPACSATGEMRRVSRGRPETLGAAKPGDWIIIGIEFPALAVEDIEGTNWANAAAELVSCMIVRSEPNTTVIVARVMQAPEFAVGHGLKYGELIRVALNNVLKHSSCTQEEFEKAKAGGLFTFAPVNPIAPIVGREFFTRDGDRVRVFGTRNDSTGQYVTGQGRGSGAELEWNMDGTHRKGNRSLDLVALTEVVNA